MQKDVLIFHKAIYIWMLADRAFGTKRLITLVILEKNDGFKKISLKSINIKYIDRSKRSAPSDEQHFSTLSIYTTRTNQGTRSSTVLKDFERIKICVFMIKNFQETYQLEVRNSH